MDYQKTEQIFEELYAKLRDDVGECAPSSFTYYGKTIEEVEADYDLEFGGFYEHFGSEEQSLVAVVYSTDAREWYAIHADATDDDVRQNFAECMGFED